MPCRRTFASGIVPFAHSEETPLRHPGFAGFLRRLQDMGSPDYRGRMECVKRLVTWSWSGSECYWNEVPTKSFGAPTRGRRLVACGIQAPLDMHPGYEAIRIRAGYKPAPTGRLLPGRGIGSRPGFIPDALATPGSARPGFDSLSRRLMQ